MYLPQAVFYNKPNNIYVPPQTAPIYQAEIEPTITKLDIFMLPL